MASFHDLYDSCFKNASLLRIPSSNTMNKTGAAKNGTSTPNSNGHATPNPADVVTTLHNVLTSSKVICFYFMTSYSPQCLAFTEALKHLHRSKTAATPSAAPQSSPHKVRRFFGFRRKSKQKKTSATVTVDAAEISVVVVCLDPAGADTPLTALGDAGWFALAPESVRTKTRLMRALHFQQAPSLVLVESCSRQIITADGKRSLLEDPNGLGFPWWTPSASLLFQGALLQNTVDGDGTVTQTTVDFDDIKPTVKGLYFGNQWCPPCRVFTKQLKAAYETLKANGVPFEVILCSSDRTEESFRRHFETMPWLSFPFDDEKLKSLTRLFNVNGIPALLILDENNRLITRHGRNAILGDPEGKNFPWNAKAMYELTEFTVCRLKEEPSLVLFTEGSPDDVAFSKELLHSVAELALADRQTIPRSRSTSTERSDENGNGGSVDMDAASASSSSADSDAPVPSYADPLQFFYTGDDPICDQVLESLGLSDAELPLLVIVDALAGQVAVCDQPEVSDGIVSNFIADFKADRLAMIPWVSTGANYGPTQVGGIPVSAISQALGFGQSPSQTSMAQSNEDGPADSVQ
uniref:Thioredoxin domain-containing protein n=1 Tax=Plectus sambesii TaxID=2011161 RepID=A0A914W2F4_9BILA